MWCGMAAAQWLLKNRATVLTGALPSSAKWLAFLGTWSLTYYMLHQPVMIGVMTVLRGLGA
jgi:peptidoglycan/LPS O-acetylase OafA/YrhL